MLDQRKLCLFVGILLGFLLGICMGRFDTTSIQDHVALLPSGRIMGEMEEESILFTNGFSTGSSTASPYTPTKRPKRTRAPYTRRTRSPTFTPTLSPVVSTFNPTASPIIITGSPTKYDLNLFPEITDINDDVKQLIHVPFHSPLPPKRVHWCHSREDFLSQPLLQLVEQHLNNTDGPPRLILLVGDSTLHEPFTYISRCLFKRGYGRRSGNGTKLVFSVHTPNLQVLYFPNYWKSQVYSDWGNRIPGKQDLWTEYAMPGYVPTLAWANFGLLHILHRVPLSYDVGDFLAWNRLERWIIEDVLVLVREWKFTKLLVSGPHACCLDRLTLPRKELLHREVDMDACRNYFHQDFVDSNKLDEFCLLGINSPNGTALLRDKVDDIIRYRMWPRLKQEPSLQVMGYLDNYNATQTLCELKNTNDGIHYESLVPLQVESMLQFLIQ